MPQNNSLLRSIIALPALTVLLSSPRAPAVAQACAWSVSEAPMASSPYISAVDALSGGDMWAVGSYLGSLSLTMHYDGSAWSIIPSPHPGDSYNQLLSVSMISQQDVWAVGWTQDVNIEPFILHWDGGAWTQVPAPTYRGDATFLTEVDAVGPDDVWGVGYARVGDNVIRFVSVAEHWDGTAWSLVPVPQPSEHRESQLLGVKAFATDDVWAVGAWTFGTMQVRTLTEHWNGNTWSVVRSEGGRDQLTYLQDVDGRPSAGPWAVGATGNPSNGLTSVRTQRWDGSRWNRVEAPAPPTPDSWFYDVSVLSADDVWAVGIGYQGSGSVSQTLTEHWGGQAWTLVPSPDVDVGNYLFGVVAVGSDDVWAVGYSIRENGNSDPLILHYTCS